MLSLSSNVILSNKVEMPILGLGVYLSKEGQEVTQAVEWALEAGYRHIDTAAIYRNEIGVGEAIRNSSIPRDNIFVTTKVWNSDQGFNSTLMAFDESLKKLKLEYIDLYLIHWPVNGKYIDTWKALEKLYRDGRVKAIGVSNFMKHHLQDLLAHSDIVPMVNQMEYHPYLQQPELLQFCIDNNIQYEAWSPLMQGKIFGLQEWQELSEKYNKTIAQLVLRWNIQNRVVTIPKSVKKDRIIENADIFNFEIAQDDMNRIAAMDKNHRVGPDPDNFDF